MYPYTRNQLCELLIFSNINFAFLGNTSVPTTIYIRTRAEENCFLHELISLGRKKGHIALATTFFVKTLKRIWVFRFYYDLRSNYGPNLHNFQETFTNFQTLKIVRLIDSVKSWSAMKLNSAPSSERLIYPYCHLNHTTPQYDT